MNGVALTQYPTVLPTVNGIPVGITYRPNVNANGKTSLVYYLVDNSYLHQRTPEYTVSIVINPVNDPPVWSVDRSSIVLGRTNTSPYFTFSIYDIDSSSFAFDISAAERANIPRPSTMVFSGPSGVVNALDYSYSPIAVIDNPVFGAVINVTLSWSPDVLLPDGSTVRFQIPLCLLLIGFLVALLLF